MALETELKDNPEAVHVTDGSGRTALDWATSLGHLSHMELLIEAGSSLDSVDDRGRSTVLHAVDSHNTNALRLVLEAGANPNPTVPEGLLRSSPLQAACFGGLVEMIKMLLDFGAEVDACNPEGWTALQRVASTQDVVCAQILLTHGANLYQVSRNGHSPLTRAIIYNNHNVLEFFIRQSHSSLFQGPRLLPFVAESADAQTMSILASSNLVLNENLVNVDDFTSGLESIRLRLDYDDRLQKAFEEFRVRVLACTLDGCANLI